MINLTINNRTVSVPEGSTILEAAKLNNTDIPHLCHLEGVHKYGACRLCVVEVEGAKKLQASCMVQVKDGMVVQTNTDQVRRVRKNVYELLLSNHPKDCLSCETNKNCELQDIGNRLGVTQARFSGQTAGGKVDISPAISRDMAKCILCRRCVTVCNETQNVGILNAQNRGFATVVGPAMNLPIHTVNCTTCGQCTVVCPVGAIKETDAVQNVWEAINDKNIRVVAQVTPAVSSAIGEEFGYEPGTALAGEVTACLRELGFHSIFDTTFAADLTSIEQGAEFLTRLKQKLDGQEAKLPLITSCSPGWIKYAEHNYPEELEYLSTCKSPDTMLGALIKSYYAEKINVDPQELFVVSIGPCTAKKFEISRPEMENNSLANVDAVLTTRELARMIKEAGIDLRNIASSRFDHPFALSSCAAELFEVSGGITEATMRAIYEKVTGRKLPFDKLAMTSVTGLDQIKEVELRIEEPLDSYQYLAGFTVKAAVTSGLRGAKILLDQIVKGESPYHFIEVLGCSRGCFGGGGQPRSLHSDIVPKRLQAFLQDNPAKACRDLNEKELITKLYEDFLQEPNSCLANELLHTHYTRRGKYNQYIIPRG